jgi:Trypsin-like peptidase domain
MLRTNNSLRILSIALLIQLYNYLSTQAQSTPVNNDATDNIACTVDMVPLKDYKSTMQLIINKRNKAVITFLGPNGSQIGSGTLIGPDLILTASQCIRAMNDNHGLLSYRAAFGYELRNNGTIAEIASFPVKELVEIGGTNFSYDYAIVKINGSPLQNNRLINYGLVEPTPIKAYTPAIGDPIAVIGHPAAYFNSQPNLQQRPKAVDSGIVTSIDKTTLAPMTYFRHGIKTNDAGSGLLDQDGYLIGITGYTYINDCSGLGDGAFALHDAILVSHALKNICNCSTISIEPVGVSSSAITLYASVGENKGENTYIRNSAISEWNNSKKFIHVANVSDECIFNGYIRPYSQTLRYRIGRVYIKKIAIREAGKSYQVVETLVLENFNSGATFFSSINTGVPMLISFEFENVSND